MRIVIEKTGQIISLSQLDNVILRTDLIPVPVNLEFTVKLDDALEAALTKGAVLIVGDQEISMTIVKVLKANTQLVVDDQRISIASVVAILTGCESLISPLNKAIILNDTSFAQSYRAAGCKLKFGDDIPLSSYVAPHGSWATQALAVYFQEEAALPVFQSGVINVWRLSKFLSQDGILIDNSAVAWINNPFVESKAVANYMSVAEDGTMAAGTAKGASSRYYPDADTRVLKNLNTVLFTRGTVTRTLDSSINAGDIFLIDDKKYIVLTAAHQFKTGALGGGNSQASKYWISEIVSNG